MDTSFLRRVVIAGAAALCLVMGSTAYAGAPAAPYIWTEIVIPHFTMGQAFGLNDRGQVAVASADGNISGIYRRGTFTRLPTPPAGYQVTAMGINNEQVITGVAHTTSDMHEQGFILSGGVYRFFSFPGATDTEPRAIGHDSLITGSAFSDVTGERQGFIYDPAGPAWFTTKTPAGSAATFVQGVNQSDRISGNGVLGDIGSYAFVSQFFRLQQDEHGPVPIAFFDRTLVAGGPSWARGINDAGIITGFTVAGGQRVGFVGNAIRGYTLLLPPGAEVTGNSVACEGINNLNQVVCLVTDASLNVRAFIGKPKPAD
jgi:hypothetical protein